LSSASGAAGELPASLTLVGAGKMGGAMLEGWLALGLAPERITVVDPGVSPAMSALCLERGIAVNPLAAAPAEVLVLAIKPQSLAEAAAGLDRLVERETLLVSVLAGKTVANLRQALPRAGAVIRAMPNLPASIGRGATGAYASPEVTADQRAAADRLLSGIGLVEWVGTEDLVDAVTALSGSGPAYVFHLVECMAEAGQAVGLPPEAAQRLARATVAGAGELLGRSDLPAATLRENVTSPGGTTAAALQVLMGEPGLKGLMREAVAAAKRRAGELSG
jgi:pyrroline-5-carboxylate reductase